MVIKAITGHEVISPPTNGEERGSMVAASSARKSSKDQFKSRRHRVLLVDSNELMRWVAGKWINYSPDLEVCGGAGGATHAFWVMTHRQPDIIVTEILEPVHTSFIRELHRRHPRVPILVFSIHDEEVYGAQARAAGADGYLTKMAGGAKLVRTVRAVLRRRRKRPAKTLEPAA